MSRLRLLSQKREMMGTVPRPKSPTNPKENVAVGGELQVVPLFSNKDRRHSRLTNVSAHSGKSEERLRAVSKDGDCNVYCASAPTHSFFRDVFTTIVDMKWRWTLVVFASGFLVSWTAFAVLWWLIATVHGDLDTDHLPPNQKASNWTPCVLEVYGFTSCFLFSVETQHTTGYGIKAPTDACPDALLLMCAQNIFGLIVEAFLVGTVFAKMTRPKFRARTIRFSRHAVVCKRENHLCLMFRVGDVRTRSRIVEARLKAQLIRSRRTKEGEALKYHMTRLPCSADDCERDLFVIWPVTVVHRIDESSPLYRVSAADLLQEHFEIVVLLEGTVESTDRKTQARTSYLAGEIFWGHRFEPMLSADRERGKFRVDYEKFDRTVVVDTPLCSALELRELQQQAQQETLLGN